MVFWLKSVISEVDYTSPPTSTHSSRDISDFRKINALAPKISGGPRSAYCCAQLVLKSRPIFRTTAGILRHGKIERVFDFVSIASTNRALIARYRRGPALIVERS